MDILIDILVFAKIIKKKASQERLDFSYGKQLPNLSGLKQQAVIFLSYSLQEGSIVHSDGESQARGAITISRVTNDVPDRNGTACIGR